MSLRGPPVFHQPVAPLFVGAIRIWFVDVPREIDSPLGEVFRRVLLEQVVHQIRDRRPSHGLGRIPWLDISAPPKSPPNAQSNVTGVRVKVFAMAWRSFWSPDPRVSVLRWGAVMRGSPAAVSNVVLPATATWPPERERSAWAWPGHARRRIQSRSNRSRPGGGADTASGDGASLLGLKRSEAYKVAVMSRIALRRENMRPAYQDVWATTGGSQTGHRSGHAQARAGRATALSGAAVQHAGARCV